MILNKEFNIGFVGCGKIAHFHADVLKKLGCNLTAVSARKNSPNLKLFASKHNIPHVFYSWESMLQNVKLDALWVVASWDQMDNLLIPLIKTKIPLFLEKPIALSSKMIIEAIEIHSKTNQYIQVGYNRRFYSFIEEVKKIIQDGIIRSVIMEIPESVDIKDRKQAENLWFSNSSHVIDLLYYLVGPMKVESIHRTSSNSENIIDTFNGMLINEGGIPIHLISNWNSPANFGLTFYIDKLRVELKPLEKLIIYEGFELIEPTQKSNLRFYNPQIKKTLRCNSEFKPGFYGQAKTFCRKVSNNYDFTDTIPATLSDSLLTTQLIEEIIRR